MLKTRKFGLLSSSVLYGLGGAAQRLISFLLLPLFARYLTPADYGIVGLLASLPALLLPVFSLGLSASIGVCYFSSEKQTDRLVIIQTSKIITTISSVLMVVMALAALDPVTMASVNNLEYRAHTLIAIITVALTVLCLPFQLEQQFAGRPIEYVAISLGGALFTSLVSIVTIVLLELGALGMLLGSLFGQALVWILLVWLRKRSDIGKVKAEIGVATALLKHGLPMLPSFLLLFIIQNWVRWPLEKAHGVDAVGLYSLGSSLGASLTLLTSGFVSAWMPWVMSQSEQWEEARHVVAKRFTQYFIVCGFAVLLLFCVAQPALLILLPPAYFDAWLVVGLAAASNFLMSLFSLLLPPIYMAKKVFLLLISQAIAALVTAGSVYLLMDLGILGVSLAVFFGGIALVITQIAVNVKFTDIRPIPFVTGKFLLVILALGLSCFSTFLIRVADARNFIFEAIALILFAGIVMFKCFPDRQALLKRLS